MTTKQTEEMPSAYDPTSVEDAIYEFWMAKKLFTPQPDPNKKPFVMIMPPPNVTGNLHLGHALTCFMEDILIRWRRMMGDAALWLPGKDHAGIATQVVVERQLAKEGTSRHELGRSKFLDRMWQWVTQNGHTIDKQLKRMGASCDWSRLSFTLDPGPSKAVRTTFLNLYTKGLIYRGERIINWCIRCSTALSDLEVEYQEFDGELYYINYPISDSTISITVATTRPETMFADTGIAVHPEDPRYKSLIGQRTNLPLTTRLIPIVGDEAIDPEFGTGVLKVTPGHDQIDFDIGQRHNLSTITAIDDRGLTTAEAGAFQGKDRFQARQEVVEKLRTDGFLTKTEAYRHSIGHCQRCSTIVEPLVSNQWFVKITPLAAPAIGAIKKGDIKIVPKRYSRVYLNWMENIRDWCISRQLWWGHRIPVWHCNNCAHLTASVEDAQVCFQCGSKDIFQDPDVLDTWFSSGLWTHSTLGWPDDTTDFNYFYPTTVMETGYDILFFWVARMIMLGIENTGSPPFNTVLLHGLVRDSEGLKMSKTKGNVLDPLQLMDLYGTDALRFALTTGTAPGNDQRLSEDKLESSRNFVNKLWNASRFVVHTLESDRASDLNGWHDLRHVLHREDIWILSRLNQVISQADHYMNRFEFGEAQQEIYEFFWNEFCDWYIELSKIRMREQIEPNPVTVLAHVLEKTLRLLHPFMPFVTEEIWRRLIKLLPYEGSLPESIMISDYPQVDKRRFDIESEDAISQLINLVRAIRNIRAQLRVEPNQELEAFVNSEGDGTLVIQESHAIKSLAKIKSLQSGDAFGKSGSPGIVTVISGDVAVSLSLGGVINLSQERIRLSDELKKADNNLARVESLLSNSEFVAKAPKEVIDRESNRAAALKERSSRLKTLLDQLPES